MNLIQELASTIPWLKQNTERPPLTTGSRFGFGGTFQDRTAGPLGQMTSSGWLFAVIDKIATNVAAAEWIVSQVNSRGEVTQLPPVNPLSVLWANPNPFYTRNEFIETLDQHFELVGEMWVIIVRDSITGKIPVELWPVRPDRMTPIPSPTEFVSGYWYTIGSEKVRLDPEDVIFIRRPSPTNPYRGIGVVQSIISDVESENAAGQWTRNFFRNSAIPGGIIEVEEDLSDADFERVVERWRVQHQGQNNAHRVAFLERGKWVDRRFTNSDIQLEQLRNLNRDLILGAFTMPLSIMGVTENVNRANAEAGLVQFTEGIVVPRLRRLEESINTHLAQFFGENLRIDFINPTPKNKELSILEGEKGFNAGILTRNEARERYNEDAVDGGDEFKPQPQASPFVLSMPEGRDVTKIISIEKQDAPRDPAGIIESPIQREENKIQRAWAKRLQDEARMLGEFLAQFFTKLEPSDVTGYDWDWFEKYNEEVIAEFIALFTEVITESIPDISEPLLQRLASQYALERASDLLTLSGSQSMVAFTQQRVNVLVAETIANGDSLGTLQRALRDLDAFDGPRARTVARTETARALGEGRLDVAKELGHDQKRWFTQGDEHVDSPCSQNAAQGWISTSETFQSGNETVPQHPNCRCNVITRNDPDRVDRLGMSEVRCWNCNRKFGKMSAPYEIQCSRCKEMVTA